MFCSVTNIGYRLKIGPSALALIVIRGSMFCSVTNIGHRLKLGPSALALTMPWAGHYEILSGRDSFESWISEQGLDLGTVGY